MTKTEDLRIIKTKRNIEQTFLRLLETTSFQKLTIKQILEEALINRGTFYHHYLDKYDLAERVSEKYIAEAEQLLEQAMEQTIPASGMDNRPWWTALKPYSDEMINRWFLLHSLPMKNSTMEEQFKKMLFDLFYRHLKKQGARENALTRRTLAAVQLFMGYFQFYEDSRQAPSFSDYILAIGEVLHMQGA